MSSTTDIPRESVRRFRRAAEELQSDLAISLDRIRPSVVKETADWWVWLCVTARSVTKQRFAGRTSLDLERFLQHVYWEHPYLTDERKLPLLPSERGVEILAGLINYEGEFDPREGCVSRD